MLRLLKAVGVEIDLLDNQGYTPLARSAHNYAFASFAYLTQCYPDMIMYPVQFEDSKALKRLASKAKFRYYASQIALLNQLKYIVREYRKQLLLFFYESFVIILAYSMVTSSAFKSLSESSFWFTYFLLYSIALLYFGFYALWFLFRTTTKATEGRKVLSPRKKP
jgi:hypothetical protein